MCSSWECWGFFIQLQSRFEQLITSSLKKPHFLYLAGWHCPPSKATARVSVIFSVNTGSAKQFQFCAVQPYTWSNVPSWPHPLQPWQWGTEAIFSQSGQGLRNRFIFEWFLLLRPEWLYMTHSQMLDQFSASVQRPGKWGLHSGVGWPSQGTPTKQISKIPTADPELQQLHNSCTPPALGLHSYSWLASLNFPLMISKWHKMEFLWHIFFPMTFQLSTSCSHTIAEIL